METFERSINLFLRQHILGTLLLLSYRFGTCLIIDPMMFYLRKGFLSSRSAPRKLVKARRAEKQNSIPSTENHLDEFNYDRHFLKAQVTYDFESDVAWATARDKRRRIHVCWFSRVLRKLRRKDPNTILC